MKVATDDNPLVSIFRDIHKGSDRTNRSKLRHQDVSYKVVYRHVHDNMTDYLSLHATSWDKVLDNWKGETGEFEKTIWSLYFSVWIKCGSPTL